MAHVGGQKLKILRLYQILLEKSDESHPLNAVQIAAELEKFGISAERKGIYSDIDILLDADIDVIKTSSGYYIGERTFELPELKLLADAVGASKFISEKKSKELLKKLESLTSASLAKQLSRQVVVPDRVKTDNEKIFYTIDTIYQSIDENKQLSFQYEEWDVNKKKVLRRNGERYMVSPAFLIRNDENYYLVAFDEKSKEVRHYRVDKMVSAAIENEDRGGVAERDSLNPEEYARLHVSMFSGEETTVTIKVKKALVGVLLDKFGADITVRPFSQEEARNFSNDKLNSSSKQNLNYAVNGSSNENQNDTVNGSTNEKQPKECSSTSDYIRARVSVAVSPQFYGWVAGIGGKIIAPEAEAAKYEEYLKSILNL